MKCNMIYNMYQIICEVIQRYNSCKIYDISQIATHFKAFNLRFLNYVHPFLMMA